MDLVSYMNFFNSLPINEAAKGKILRGNALRALRLDPESYPDTWDQ
jgi:predicted TIM-barrel fold metal-dependent hydrolase